MLAITAMFAFVLSVVLLRSGVTSMAIRYPIAVVSSYVFFLFLLRIWIWLQREKKSGSIDLPDDVITSTIDIPGGSSVDKFSFGGGGDFSGAGAGGSFADADVPSPSPVMFAGSTSNSSVGGGSGSSGGSWSIDIDDGWVLLLVGLILVLILGALIYVIYIAPVLLAELMIDAAVVSSLYRPVKNIERSHWLMTALRTTGIPALLIALLFGVAGYVMSAAEPAAVTIGQFVRAILE
jgi:hypothetical protein